MRALPSILVTLSLAANLLAGDFQQSNRQLTVPEPEVDFLTGRGVSLGQILFPHFHATAAYGESSGEVSELHIGGHDPNRDGWTVQALEFGLSGKLGPVEAFANYAGTLDHAWHWQGDWEEAFGKIRYEDLGLELRGGIFLNRLGLHNNTHAHGWDWVDQHLVSGRFLGEEGLAMKGGEATWKLPVPMTTLLSVAVGEARAHDHAHGEEGHAEDEPEFEAEGAAFNDLLVAVNLTAAYDLNDFHQQRFGLSFAAGDNAWERTTRLYGLHYQYQWRENGFETGGRSLRWTNEIWLRHAAAISGHLPGEEAEEHHEEEEEEEASRRKSLDDLGVYSQLLYGLDDRLYLGLRAEYVSGLSEMDSLERFRLSPAITWFLNRERTLYFRLQYNYDRGHRLGEEHSIWAQLGFNWGGSEVR